MYDDTDCEDCECTMTGVADNRLGEEASDGMVDGSVGVLAAANDEVDDVEED
jgi:hypothetical protein